MPRDLLTQYRSHLYLALTMISLFGLYTLYERWPRPEPIQIVTPSETPCAVDAPMQQPTVAVHVHVAGAVARPGVYVLGDDARIIDAVSAAGGLTADADPEGVNLADRIGDGQQLHVPRLGVVPPPSPTPMPQPLEAVAAVATGGALVNINTASQAELESLSGIGPVLAQRIIAYRDESGPFEAIEDIMRVPGIAEGYFARIRDYITVEQ